MRNNLILLTCLLAILVFSFANPLGALAQDELPPTPTPLPELYRTQQDGGLLLVSGGGVVVLIILGTVFGTIWRKRSMAGEHSQSEPPAV